MRLLADENVPYPAISRLRDDGYDVKWIGEEHPGVSDLMILEQARKENRLLLTFDKDFGTLSFGDREPAPGILLFRVPALPIPELIPFVVQTVKDRDDWHGHLAVIEENQIRMRPLPSD